MKFLQKLFLILFIILLPSTLNAKSVNLLVNQIDGVQDKVRESVQIVENSIMDFLFDAGHIVSAEKISLEKDLSKTVQIALDSSINGYFDYLVVIKIYLDAETDDIKYAQWEVKNVNTNESIGSGKLDGPKPVREKEVGLRRFGFNVGSEISSCIKGK